MTPDWKIERESPRPVPCERVQARLYLDPKGPAWCLMIEPVSSTQAELHAWLIPYANLHTTNIEAACKAAPDAMIASLEQVIAELRKIASVPDAT